MLFFQKYLLLLSVSFLMIFSFSGCSPESSEEANGVGREEYSPSPEETEVSRVEASDPEEAVGEEEA